MKGLRKFAAVAGGCVVFGLAMLASHGQPAAQASVIHHPRHAGVVTVTHCHRGWFCGRAS